MGMSAGDLARIKRELGMVKDVRGEAGAFYKIQSAWLRELIHENAALHKIVADYHCGGNEQTLRTLFAERDAALAEVERLTISADTWAETCQKVEDERDALMAKQQGRCVEPGCENSTRTRLPRYCMEHR